MPCKSDGTSRLNVERVWRVWDAFCSGARVVGVSTSVVLRAMHRAAAFVLVRHGMWSGSLESVRERAGAGARAAESAARYSSRFL